MSSGATQKKWLKAVFKQLSAMDGVEYEMISNGHLKIKIRANDKIRTMNWSNSPKSTRVQKEQYKQLRAALLELGVNEKLKFVAAKRGANPSSSSAADSEQHKERLNAVGWSFVWREIRKAEKSLDR
jgi:hypothetical protein